MSCKRDSAKFEEAHIRKLLWLALRPSHDTSKPNAFRVALSGKKHVEKDVQLVRVCGSKARSVFSVSISCCADSIELWQLFDDVDNRVLAQPASVSTATVA